MKEAMLKGLNPEQQEAVQHTDGPLLIMAGAGSGKTRVLTNRIAYLIGEKGVPHWSILAITFTNKAAREMKERVAKNVGPEAEEMWVSTFHSMCVRILRRDIDRIGFSRNFTILDASDQQTVLKRIVKELNIDSKKFDPRTLLGSISSAKNELKTAADYGKTANSYYEQTVQQVYEAYERELKRNQALDFDDLIMTTIKLFKQVSEVLEYYQRRFRYIMVDEYQDTNRAQYVLVNLMAERHKNLCVVGDSDQSIYKWRGADIQNILSFEKDYPDAKVVMLEKNYRSSKRILDAANKVIDQNQGRKPKNLWTDNHPGEKIVQYEAGNEHEEARFIVGEIQEKIKQNEATPADIAVLYRTNAQSRVMEELLVKSNMPYTIVGGTKFYDRKEIKDLLAYLRVIANPDDDISLRRIINVPKRGIGQSTVDKLDRYAADRDISLMEMLDEVSQVGLSARFTRSLEAFRDHMRNWIQMQDYLPVSELIEELLEKTGYRKVLKEDQSLESEGRLENIDEFLTVAKEFEDASEDKTLIAFLTDLALVADIDKVEEEDEKEEKVLLMTLHSAKGLEFPYVFLIGLEEGVFPHSRSLMEEKEMEEERRLAYVGITRAEKQLYMTRAARRTMFGKTNANPASRFLSEVPDELIERKAKDGGLPKDKDLPWKKEAAERSDATGARVGAQSARSPKPQPTSTGGASFEWHVGDKAKHGKWGVGTVVSARGDGENTELDIAFPEVGVKRLAAKFAPITKE
ncbi:DNA helicase PcrA [Salisediminibacterium halotolerans]|uniref:ATP-dependent DNA helicase n=1 Tax=Salisediminibacterium halotolerans TaxID=517425 RepID=A0A1H9VVI7_9BACI|nr:MULTISPECIES: DNA helicase PcrA [Salisediminibacterium]RLJ71776.1 DNA helicase-2/ATP-dependent DNA helicase PcrA [Actinophytocola xinjiangensis]RPE86926.1 DNA helicase-2/ATP-dependent DNA helicase PcrA [Salisediminibacterium halotolerans]TWG32989.1 DNA helicase-2/ATP-dependent DNA helicase PcrA [Salisediminibacterium halotolerans]SES25632.1 DNA helicase-2 / ATP-dependent DNA helicase PcrA [Salisediminibacterium haloalkalitolerans]GEL08540.1 DNA helicase [Salisediminibacterium halotolerans]